MKPVIAANWKMNLTLTEVKELLHEISDAIRTSNDVSVMICPSNNYLLPVQQFCMDQGLNVMICAQNISEYQPGAYTGDVSANMVKSCGATHVLLGHSERRHVFNETNDMLKTKLSYCKDTGLIPVLCVGETLTDREQDKTESVIKQQLSILSGFDGEFMVAYEPVWAIGTGKTATPEMAQAVHEFIRNECPEECVVLYGGSVKKANVEGLLQQSDINGALIGGASLVAEEFSGIVSLSNQMAVKKGV
jgi:triosephosphate isomerase